MHDACINCITSSTIVFLLFVLYYRIAHTFDEEKLQ